MEYKIARIPGDGIGPEISEEAVRVLERMPLNANGKADRRSLAASISR